MIRICHFITEIEELSSQKSDVVFVKVDVDDNEEAAEVRLFFYRMCSQLNTLNTFCLFSNTISLRCQPSFSSKTRKKLTT